MRVLPIYEIKRLCHHDQFLYSHMEVFSILQIFETNDK